jgi:hypothetical protein
MHMTLKAVQSNLQRWRFVAWILIATAFVSFIAGALFAARLTRLKEVRADNNRVFELMIYHTVSGKVPALETIFRDVAKLQSKYNLNVIGYWVPNEDPDWKDTFVYLCRSSQPESSGSELVRASFRPGVSAVPQIRRAFD